MFRKQVEPLVDFIAVCLLTQTAGSRKTHAYLVVVNHYATRGPLATHLLAKESTKGSKERKVMDEVFRVQVYRGILDR